MGDLRHSFDPVFFTQEEKEQLTARLRQAAEQEDNMKDSTKRAIRHTSHRLIIGVAVAAALTTGALAAAVGGGLMGYFEARTPEDQSTLEEGIYQLNRSETHNGWTVELTDCIGDDSNVYLWVDVTAPEGTALTPPEGGWISSSFQAELPEDVSAAMMTSLTALPDEDAGDNRISFCIMINAVSGDLRGKQVDITIEPITGTKNPMGKLDAGVRFTKRPTAVMFDYKVKLSGKPDRVRQTGFSKVKRVAGKDLADCILYLQKRWEDKDGNIYAKRIGTMVKRFDRNTGWVNNASFTIHYGDITKQPFYRSYMGLTAGDVVKYARNSRGKMVPVHEVGWGSAGDTPTHLVLQFDSSHGGAYVGSVGNTLWIDNVRLVY